MPDQNEVTVIVDGGVSISVQWTSGMCAEDAMKLAVENTIAEKSFIYATQYYGKALGNLVFMINHTYDTFQNQDHPYFYWDFLVRHLGGELMPSPVGVDSLELSVGDVIEFRFTTYDSIVHAGTTIAAKHAALTRK